MISVLGLDPSLTSFGAALAMGDAKPQLVRWRPKDRGHQRLGYLRDLMLGVASHADLVVLEGLAFGAKGSAVLDLAGLHWLLRQALWEVGQPYVVIAPMLRAKWLTGKGNASKDECLAAAVKRFPAADIDGNDVADALTLAAMGMDHLGQPIAAMPADRRELLYSTNRKQLPQIMWPATSAPQTVPGTPETR